MKRINSKPYKLATFAVSATLFCSQAAFAEDVTLRVADHYPAGASSAEITIKYFMKKAEEESNGQIKFQYFPAEQLGKAKDMLSLTVSGVTDIGLIAPPYISDKMPLSGVAELPGTFSDTCEGTMAFWKLAHEGPLADHDFTGNGIRPLLVMLLPPYQILTKPPLTGLKDLQNLKLRTGGGVQDISIKAIGAVPVRIAGPDIYELLTRGTLDGLVFPLPSLFEYKLQDLVKYTTRGQNFGSFSVTYSISLSKWKQLPDDAKAILDKVGEETTHHACELMQSAIQPALDRLSANGVKIVDLPSADEAQIKADLRPVADQWASQLDSRGLAGTDVLNAFRNALKQ